MTYRSFLPFRSSIAAEFALSWLGIFSATFLVLSLIAPSNDLFGGRNYGGFEQNWDFIPFLIGTVLYSNLGPDAPGYIGKESRDDMNA